MRAARADVRQRAWELAGDAAPGADGGLVPVDIDATIVTAHSQKEQASPTWKKTFGFHPLAVFADHGQGGSGEALAVVLRSGNAGSNTAADHIEAVRLALAQLPRHQRWRVLIRTDSGGGTHEFLAWLTAPARRLAYSVGMNITEDTQQAILKVPARAWIPAYDADGQVRPGAWVAEITGVLNLAAWPAGMRVIVRKERPHPGAQLRFTDTGGHRFTCLATNAKGGQLADLELRHGRRARCEDRIRAAKDTGPRNLPFHGFTKTRSGASWWQWRASWWQWRASWWQWRASWWQWRASYWPGLRCSPCTARPGAGNPNGCGCACSAPPGASSPPAGACSCASQQAGYGPATSPQRSASFRLSPPADQPEPPQRPRKENRGTIDPRPPGATAGPPR
jgi:hypothetical protein